jgi:Permuted papain-like amidase enzyme, YaeF/YiiX, C92 family
MYKIILAAIVVSALACQPSKQYAKKVKASAPNDAPLTQSTFRNGDIIFNCNKHGQGLAIQLATKSIYTHCGLLFWNERKQEWYVTEAVQPVRSIPLEEWQEGGEDNYYIVKRLKNIPAQMDANASALNKAANKYLGRDYDAYFNFSDEQIYCSELVYKSYFNAYKITLGTIQQLKDFDLSHPAIAKIVAERYGTAIPWEEKVISPASIFADTNLVTVFEHGDEPAY